jgi:hypothetical protein
MLAAVVQSSTVAEIVAFAATALVDNAAAGTGDAASGRVKGSSSCSTCCR